MLNFESDYTRGAHPEVLRALLESNMEHTQSYGQDAYSLSAAARIRAACEAEVDVYLLVGGTQTNMMVIGSVLDSFEGVIAAESGHISTHEAGAIEHTGHKVLTLPHREGKLCAAEVDAFVRGFYADPVHEHMVFPGMVYISQPTEYGTLYSAAELRALRKVCDAHGLFLYADGARLGYALACGHNDVGLAQLAALCDAFYIGGTKVGALCGEALVFGEGRTPARFRTRIKQEGAMLAKGRLLGVQFDALFTDGLYVRIAKNAIETADALRAALREAGYETHIESPTNQVFVRMPRARYERLSRQVLCSYWESLGEEECAVRFVTDWATTREDVEALRQVL